MPWHVSSDHESCDGYAVVKDDTDEVVGCHATREEANRHMAALYASESDKSETGFMKALPIGDAQYRVLAIPFGGPMAGGKDLQGERFTIRTDIKADWFDRRPVLLDHGLEAKIGDTVVGTQGPLEMEDDGWWADVWLDRSSRYWEAVNRLLAAGKMYGSSGALSHLVKVAADGEILVWPHIEQTLTPTPANPYARISTLRAVDAFKSAGIVLPPEWDDAPDVVADATVARRRRRVITTLR